MRGPSAGVRDRAREERRVLAAELRDPDKTYNKLDRAGLQKLTPKLDWDGYFKATGHPEVTQINVADPGVLRGPRASWRTRPTPATLQAYLQWNVLRDAATVAPEGASTTRTSTSTARRSRARRSSSRAGSAASRDRRRAGRDPRPGVRQEAVRRRQQEDRARDDRERSRRRSPGTSRAHLDGRRRRASAPSGRRRRSPTRSATPTSGGTTRSSRSRRATTSAIASPPRRSSSSAQAAKIGKPVDKTEWQMTPADGQRLLQRAAQRDGVPGRHPAAAVLLEGLPRGDELRRHRHGHGPRADARLRRRGPQVRRPRAS